MYIRTMQTTPSIHDNYFPTLATACHAFVERVKEQGGAFLVQTETLAHVCGQFSGGVSYGQTVSRSFELVTIKGKSTKKWAHVTLYRMESGNYELTAYVL